MKRFLSVVGLAGVAAVAISCGTTTPTTPGGGGTTLAVSAVAPASLSTTGGVSVTITGTGFGADSTITIGGTAITGATVTATSITATAPVHAPGASTVVVTSGGKTASSNIMFVAPSGLNSLPVIANLRVTGPGSKPPSPFVDLTSSVQLSATVTDLETSPASLTYTWTVAAGTVSGTGASATWVLPASLAVTPSALTATLTVAEVFTENGIQHRNSATASFLADAHDSSTEILEMGFRFLNLFSQSTVSPATVVSDFDQTCGGYTEELGDTVRNRQTYLFLSYAITRLPPVTFNYGQRCPNPKANPSGDACTVYNAHWVVRVLRNDSTDGVTAGQIITTDGRDFIGNVFRSGQWKLCSSNFDGVSVVSSSNSAASTTQVIPTPQGLVPGRIRRQQ